MWRGKSCVQVLLSCIKRLTSECPGACCGFIMLSTDPFGSNWSCVTKASTCCGVSLPANARIISYAAVRRVAVVEWRLEITAQFRVITFTRRAYRRAPWASARDDWGGVAEPGHFRERHLFVRQPEPTGRFGTHLARTSAAPFLARVVVTDGGGGSLCSWQQQVDTANQSYKRRTPRPRGGVWASEP